MANKETILMATLELASEKGLGQVSLSQIAKKAGIQKSTIYSHFSSKDEIIDALYEFLRKKIKKSKNIEPLDYGVLVKGKEAKEILKYAVSSYINMNEDDEMKKFYRFIISERAVNSAAAKIMIWETEKMILTTKQLFYAMQVQHVMEFKNIDMAAFSFAMAIHSIIDYGMDMKLADKGDAEKFIDDYIDDFCKVYDENV